MKLPYLISILSIVWLALSPAQDSKEDSKAEAPAKPQVEATEAKPGEDAPPAKGDKGDPLKKLDLPGVTINADERYVDVDSVVCLDDGALELVATLKDSKEHESIISVLAKPVHIHMALLLIGAQPGNPAMQKPIGEGEDKRWVFIPARGQKVHVSLVVEDEEGKPVEKPIAEFIRHVGDEAAFIEELNNPGKKVEEKKFPTSEFLFVGSHLVDNGDGPRRYIAEESGNVISISTFGDEMLGLSEVFGHVNGSLVWEIDTDVLPKMGSQVTLRLRPVFEP